MLLNGRRMLAGRHMGEAHQRPWLQSRVGTVRRTPWETRELRRGWGQFRALPGDCRGLCGNHGGAVTAGTSGSAGTHMHRGWELCTYYTNGLTHLTGWEGTLSPVCALIGLGYTLTLVTNVFNQSFWGQAHTRSAEEDRVMLLGLLLPPSLSLCAPWLRDPKCHWWKHLKSSPTDRYTFSEKLQPRGIWNKKLLLGSSKPRSPSS